MSDIPEIPRRPNKSTSATPEVAIDEIPQKLDSRDGFSDSGASDISDKDEHRISLDPENPVDGESLAFLKSSTSSEPSMIPTIPSRPKKKQETPQIPERPSRTTSATEPSVQPDGSLDDSGAISKEAPRLNEDVSAEVSDDLKVDDESRASSKTDAIPLIPKRPQRKTTESPAPSAAVNPDVASEASDTRIDSPTNQIAETPHSSLNTDPDATENDDVEISTTDDAQKEAAIPIIPNRPPNKSPESALTAAEVKGDPPTSDYDAAETVEPGAPSIPKRPHKKVIESEASKDPKDKAETENLVKSASDLPPATAALTDAMRGPGTEAESPSNSPSNLRQDFDQASELIASEEPAPSGSAVVPSIPKRPSSRPKKLSLDTDNEKLVKESESAIGSITTPTITQRAGFPTLKKASTSSSFDSSSVTEEILDIYGGESPVQIIIPERVTQESTGESFVKKPPPPKPKKASSKILAFQQQLMASQAQAQEKPFIPTHRPKPPSRSSTSSSITSGQEESSKEDAPVVPKSRPNKVQHDFAKNLNGLWGGVALPGMVLPGQAPPAALSKSVEEEDEEPVKDLRKSRAKGPRGRKLPKGATEPVIKNESRFTIHIADAWELKPVVQEEFEDAKEVIEHSDELTVSSEISAPDASKEVPEIEAAPTSLTETFEIDEVEPESETKPVAVPEEHPLAGKDQEAAVEEAKKIDIVPETSTTEEPPANEQMTVEFEPTVVVPEEKEGTIEDEADLVSPQADVKSENLVFEAQKEVEVNDAEAQPTIDEVDEVEVTSEAA